MFYFVLLCRAALADKDFIALTQTLYLTTGQSPGSSVCTDIYIVDDSEVEGDETFAVSLSTTYPGVSVSRSTSVVEILDNDLGKGPGVTECGGDSVSQCLVN